MPPGRASAQDKPAADAKPAAKAPDIEPIDPTLLFEAEVRKELRLSDNQIRQLTEAWEKGTQAAAEDNKRVAELDERIKKLQQEIEKLDQERGTHQRAIHKAQTDQVKAAIPDVLSREATNKLRQMTLQRMNLRDVLLDARMRSRLDLNDEQVKKIQELSEKGNKEGFYRVAVRSHAATIAYTQFEPTGQLLLIDGVSDASRAELLKVLTPAQRQALERMSGMKLDGK